MAVECTFDLANVVVSLAGVAIGGLVGFLSAQRISDRNTRAIAYAKLRSAFAPTLAFIYLARHHGTHDKPSIDLHIKNALLNHGAAVEEFRPFVSINRYKTYQEAWEKYRKIAVQCRYETAGEESDWGAKEGEIIESSISEILRLAEP